MATKRKRTINDEIEHVLIALSAMKVDSKEYELAAKNLQALCEARSKKETRLFDPDTVLVVGAGIAQVVFIVYFEQLHVLSSKALNYVFKGRF